MDEQDASRRDNAAIPSASEPRYRLSGGVLAAPGIAGIAGIACLPFTLALWRSAALSVKVAATACPILVAAAAAIEYSRWKGENSGRIPRKTSRQLSLLGDYLEHQFDRSRPLRLQIFSAGAGILIATRIKTVRGW